MTTVEFGPADETGGEGIILFGGSGYLGPYILEKYPNMISVGRSAPTTSNRHLHVDSLANLDVLDEVAFDRVIYIVGNTDHHNLEKEVIAYGEPTAFDYHVVPLLQTMEQLKQYPIKKLMHFSTILIYDDKKITNPVSEHSPIDPYKNRYVLSKYLAEEACKFYAQWMPIINIRTSNLYGPTPLDRYDLIHLLIRQLVDTGAGDVWNTEPERDFIYVEDLADGVMRLIETDYTGTVNLGTGQMTSVGRIVEILEELSGCPIGVRGLPVQGPMKFQCDTTTVDRLTGWRPKVPIEEGVRQTYEIMKAWRDQ